MPDVFSKRARSKIMATIRSDGNKSTELRLVAILRAHAIRGWRRHFRMIGRPDFVFLKHKLAIFVDGCFWHGCPWHYRPPRARPEYWHPKLARNKSRDRRNSLDLRRRGWTVLRIWEHQLKGGARVARRIASALKHAPGFRVAGDDRSQRSAAPKTLDRFLRRRVTILRTLPKWR